MPGGRILAVCQSGGEFATNRDGAMSYSGGEAHAIDIDRDMLLSDLKSEISTMFYCKDDTFCIKYFLPNNKRTLITISSDKDLQRMVDFHGDSPSADIYILKKGEKRVVRSIVADSSTPTEATNGTIGTIEDAKRQQVCTEWDNLITGVGQVFDGPRALRAALHKYAIANSFLYKLIKNDSLRLTAACNAEGCPWRIHASSSPNKQEFVVRKFSDTHTCEREAGKEHSRLATQRWVASVIKEKLKDTPNYKPKDIANDLQQEYGLNLNYTQAWRGKFFAKQELHNSHEQACNQLPWFCERILETNPGSVATFEMSDDSKCRLFVAFYASLSGFEHGCRPLLFLDGISLKASKRWKLLAATAVDGENGIFPVAFSVVEAESQENWHWFLVQLKSALTTSCALTFISNKKHGLEEKVAQIFEESSHGYCVRDLTEDFKAQIEKVDDSWTQEVKDAMVENLEQCVYACKVDEFNDCIENIKAESKELAEWVLDSRPELWSNAFFKGFRYGHYSSSASETFNSWVSTRHEPSVVQMVDMIRCKMMEMIYMRRESVNTWSETLTPSVNQRIEEENTKAQTLNVICSGGTVFEVRDDSVNVVNIETSECTCRRWQVFGMPCMHAVAVFARSGGCIYDYCSRYLTTKCYCLAYSSSIMPIPDAGGPFSADYIDSVTDRPRRTTRQVGRPKERPDDPWITIKRSVRCSKCKGSGHNKQTCKSTG